MQIPSSLAFLYPPDRDQRGPIRQVGWYEGTKVLQYSATLCEYKRRQQVVRHGSGTALVNLKPPCSPPLINDAVDLSWVTQRH
jgi:hypothetical protein